MIEESQGSMRMLGTWSEMGNENTKSGKDVGDWRKTKPMKPCYHLPGCSWILMKHRYPWDETNGSQSIIPNQQHQHHWKIFLGLTPDLINQKQLLQVMLMYAQVCEAQCAKCYEWCPPGCEWVLIRRWASQEQWPGTGWHGATKYILLKSINYSCLRTGKSFS